MAFFQKVWFVFQISKSPKWKYSKLLSSAWNLNFLFTVIGGKFKFQVQDSDLEYFFSGDLEIWKTNHTFWKKATFSCKYLRNRSQIYKKITPCMYLYCSAVLIPTLSATSHYHPSFLNSVKGALRYQTY